MRKSPIDLRKEGKQNSFENYWLTQRRWKYPHKNLHTDIYSSSVHNLQTSEVTETSFGGWWIIKLWSIQTVEYYPALKRNEASSHERRRGNLNSYDQVKEVNLKKATYCAIPTVWRSGKGKTIETMKRPAVARGGRGEGTNRQSPRGVWGSENILNYVTMDAHHCTCVWTHGMCTAESEPWFPLQTRAIRMRQCGFIRLVGCWSWRRLCVSGSRGVQGTSVPASQFYCKPKTTLKKVFL